MKRYAIWNKQDQVITPVGEVLTADIRKATGSDKPAASCSQFTDELISALTRLA